MSLKTTSSSRIVIVNYGTGNLNSVKRKLDRMGALSVVSSRAEDVLKADKIILPGVGHFGTAMCNLGKLDLIDALNESVIVRQKPVLGICLGMEVMGRRSEESDEEGLGWIDAEAIRFRFSTASRYKVPHMGWNRVRISKPSSLMHDISESSEFYFAHSYYLKLNDRGDMLNSTEYSAAFPSAIEKNNIFAVQYHPEKSHDAGVQLLKNFADM